MLSYYPSVTVRGKANVTVCAFFGFSQLGGLGSQVGQITITFTSLWEWGAPKMFASGRFRRSYATEPAILQHRLFLSFRRVILESSLTLNERKRSILCSSARRLQLSACDLLDHFIIIIIIVYYARISST